MSAAFAQPAHVVTASQTVAASPPMPPTLEDSGEVSGATIVFILILLLIGGAAMGAVGARNVKKYGKDTPPKKRTAWEDFDDY
jgi:hypothetical protein